jgi:endonuclease/exonuclease/phosphatase (EEP) superfamily protein YafD
MSSDAGQRRPNRIAIASVAYLALLIGFGLFLQFTADRWWLATLLMFVPRWLLAVPLLVLIPLAIRRHRRSLWMLAASVVALMVVSGFEMPWGRFALGPSRPVDLSIRVLTCNGDERDLDPKRFHAYIEQTKPDVVVLQGWRTRYAEIVFEDRSTWHVVRNGDLCLGSRFPIVEKDRSDLKMLGGRFGRMMIYTLHTPATDVSLINVHFDSPRRAFATMLDKGLAAGAREARENLATRTEQARAVAELARSEAQTNPVLVVGDLNTPPESRLHRSELGGFVNAFSSSGWGWGNTLHTLGLQVRIDHILGYGEQWSCRRAWVGPDLGSAHRPLVADMEWDSDVGSGSANEKGVSRLPDGSPQVTGSANH